MSYGGIYGAVALQVDNISIERIIDGTSLATEQSPSGLGAANAIQVEFGAAQNTGSDPVMMDALGTVTINESGMYRIKVSLNYGRDTNPGESALRFRVRVNGTQAGATIGVLLDNAKVNQVFVDEAWLYFPAGTVLKYDIARDDAYFNAGGLTQPVNSVVGWNPTTCAAIRIERLVKI